MALRIKNDSSLERLVRQSNEVVDKALVATTKSGSTKGIPRQMFKKCKGIVILSQVLEVGLGISSTDGAGIIMAKNEDGTWSNPGAIGIFGMGAGALLGVQKKDIIVFITGDATMKSLSGEGHKVTLGASAGLTAGPDGREAEVSIDASKEGVGGAFVYTFADGCYVSVGLNSCVLKPFDEKNHRFYDNEKVTTYDILFGGPSTLHVPKDNGGISELHEKLKRLEDETETDKAILKNKLLA